MSGSGGGRPGGWIFDSNPRGCFREPKIRPEIYHRSPPLTQHERRSLVQAFFILIFVALLFFLVGVEWMR